MKDTNQGKVIVIDGVDGCGKSGQIDSIAVAVAKTHSVEVTCEPTMNSDFGRWIRRILEHKEPAPSPESFQYLFYLDRVPHWEWMQTVVKEGKTVFSDRERMVTFAYGLAGNVPVEKMVSWHEKLPVADLYIYLRVSPEEAIRRIVNRQHEKGVEIEYFEKEDAVRKNVEAFDKVASLGVIPNLVIVDGEGEYEEVTERILAEIAKVL